MKGTRFILERFYESLTKGPERKPGIHVSALSYECLRRGWYAIKYGRGFYNANTLIRFAIGTGVHYSTPMLRHHELKLDGESLSWKNINGTGSDWDTIWGTPDEYEDGVLVEKKHTSSKIPRTPRPHHVKQAEYYAVLIDHNSRALSKEYDEDFFVDEIYIVYIDVDRPAVEVKQVKMRPITIIKKEMRERQQILEASLISDIPPPREIGWICNYCSFASVDFSQDVDFGAYHGKLYAEAIELASHIEALSVDDKGVSGVVRITKKKEFAGALTYDRKDCWCACMTEETRKTLCKHLIALGLKANAKEDLTNIQVKMLLART